MRIRLSDLPEAPSLPSTQPPSVRQSSVAVKGAVSVMLSNEVRALVAALSRGLPALGAMELHELLSHEDRRMIAWASELAETQGFDPAEVEHLVVDLANYTRKSGAGSTRADSALTALTLPVLSAREESLAREILSRVSARNVPLNIGFVQAMLEPSAARTRTVSLEFLHRVVVTMAPREAEPSSWVRATFARRDARIELARAVTALALAPRELPAVSPKTVTTAALLLRERADVLALQTGRSSWSTLAQLTRNDRAVAGFLYLMQDARRGDPHAVDEVVRSLLALRAAERTAAPRETTTRAIAKAASAPPLRADDGLLRSYGSETQLAARALGAYRSLAPPAFETELALLPPQPALDVARALGLSMLIGAMHAQSLRLRRRRWLRARGASLATVEAQREQGANVESQDAASAARNERWRRLAKRRHRGRG